MCSTFNGPMFYLGDAYETRALRMRTDQPVLPHVLGSSAATCKKTHMLPMHLQLEVEFENLADLESFWARIPPQDHKAWSQRAQVWVPLLCIRLHSFQTGSMAKCIIRDLPSTGLSMRDTLPTGC